MNFPNFLSILRIILTIPVVYFIYIDELNLAIIIGIVAGITDFLDGLLARKLNQVSDFGKLIDPVADKIMVGGIGLIMIIKDLMPIWFFIAVVLRDLLILIGGLYYKNKNNVILQSNFEGKVTFFLIILTMLGVLIENEYAYTFGYYFCTAALIYSFCVYFLRFIELKQNKKIM